MSDLRPPRHGAPEPGPLAITVAREGVQQPPRATHAQPRRPRRPRRPGRTLSRLTRTRSGRWSLIAIACVAAILLGLFLTGFTSAPAKRLGALPSATGALDVSSDAPSPSRSATAAGKPAGNGAAEPLQILKNRFPDNPLNHLRADGVHSVAIGVSSGEPVAVVGYLVPTGLGSAYGTVKPHSRHWNLTEKALGPGYLAAVFVQSGRSGAPVTCSISVDGKRTNVETTSGAYGRAVCLG